MRRLLQNADEVGQEELNQQRALESFRRLPPVEPRELGGLWRGRGVPTGHLLDGVLENLGWFGKRFTPDMSAYALLFQFDPMHLTPIDPATIRIRLALRLHKLGQTRIARSMFWHSPQPSRREAHHLPGAVEFERSVQP